MTVNNRNQMDPSLEIRKLSPRCVRELVQILETHELWKRLMAIIPKTLVIDSFVCDISLENTHKYNSEHFRLIENASEKYRRACTEILLDEWGTSGRVRPALGHLLYLLKKAKLFRAADYVAVDLLNQEKPQRPTSGPEAIITVVLPEAVQERVKDLQEIEKSLDEIGYVNSALTLIRSKSEELARHQNQNATTVIPEIIISSDVEEDTQAPMFNLPLIKQREKSEMEEKNVISDMIGFSTDIVSVITESLSESETITSESSSEICEKISTRDNLNMTETNVPEISQLLNTIAIDADVINECDTANHINGPENSNEEFPAFSQLLSETNIDNLPNLSILTNQQCDNVPLENSDNFIPDFNVLNNSANNISDMYVPNISALGILPSSNTLGQSKNLSINISNLLIPTSLNSSQNSSDNSTKSRPCTSPLPNLSLNTILPHFSYSELENSTNNFNGDSYKGLNYKGRFLGSGAFGSVFLAIGLLDRPVAVKKLVLENVETVNIDDMVTKQFRNEVEVLTKYKHENLLSPLGYSCDGCTYCLLYDYIPGGSLKDRLQVMDDRLHWKVRLNIATGTARATSYLHTAFSTPLIHRDIKSANILLDSNNNPKLCDFGLIKLTPSQNTNTATTVFGTSAYMAPEAFRGDISVKLDTFSFGVVLLELLTSLPPMDEGREGTDLITHVEDTIENDDIMPLVDQECGTWEESGINFADELFKIAQQCLQEKKKRPTMVEVTTRLENKFYNS